MINLEAGKLYVVTKGSDDGTFHAGDKIRLEADGGISNFTVPGWIENEEVEEATKGMEVKLDTEWVERRRKRILDELAKLDGDK